MSKLTEIFLVFFRLGWSAFGGPAAHIAMMEEEIIRKRKWMSHQHFLDLMGITNLIPGPNSTEMVMHCGYERGGWKGLFVAGFSFIFPAVILTGVLAWAYAKYGELPDVQSLIYGIKPAVIAIILNASWKLGKKAIRSVSLGIIAFGVLILALLGIHEIGAMLIAGIVGLILFWIQKSKGHLTSMIPLLGFIPSWKIFMTFLKVGAILYGSGYVLFAFLDAELVAKGWMDRATLIDAVAVGQMTPGPVLSTATFIGYQLGSWWGAVMATLGIFLPAFVLVGVINPYVDRIRKSPLLSSVLDAVNAAAVAVIVAVCIEMGIESIQDWKTTSIALVSMALLFGIKRVNSLHIVLFGAIAGWLLSMI